MRRVLAAAVLALGLAVAGAAAATTSSAPAPVVAAYFAAFDPSFTAAQIPASRLTDVLYAFAGIDAHDHCTLGQPGLDPANFAALRALKVRYPGLQTEISIGGWSGSQHFSDAASTPARRSALVRSCIDLFLRSAPGLFDGIDIDWEFPVAGGDSTTPVRHADRADATALLAEFRRQLDTLGSATHRDYLLTAAMPAFHAGGYTPLTSWDLGAVAKIVDWINLMTYDMTGSSSPVTDFESPLHATPPGRGAGPPASANTIDWAVGFYEMAGMPAAQIVLGVPFYGHVFTHVHSRDGGLFERFRKLGDTPSWAQIEAGYLAHGQRHWSTYAQEPWQYDPRTRVFLSYDDPTAVAAKATYVRARGLRGMVAWEIGMDDASHSLLDAYATALRSATG